MPRVRALFQQVFLPADSIPPAFFDQAPALVGRSDAPLSDKLERTDGVIRPPTNIAPDMTVRPPVPNPGTTPVIPAPGTPGGDPTVDPK
jgi:hypothetical protein